MEVIFHLLPMTCYPYLINSYTYLFICNLYLKIIFITYNWLYTRSDWHHLLNLDLIIGVEVED